LSDKSEENSKKVEEELEACKKKNVLLEDQLRLQKTNWLYSHHRFLSICVGMMYGLLIVGIINFIEYTLSSQSFYADTLGLALTLFIFLGVPLIAVMVLIPLLKAPNLAFNSS